jgi:hypothetical protein
MGKFAQHDSVVPSLWTSETSLGRREAPLYCVIEFHPLGS